MHGNWACVRTLLTFDTSLYHIWDAWGVSVGGRCLSSTNRHIAWTEGGVPS